MIRIEGVTKSFGDKKVIEGIDASFDSGKCSLIIGASGSGKTVLMKIMVGLMQPTTGNIFYGGRTDLTNLDKKHLKAIRQEVGMLFQGGALFDSLTVEENIIFPLNMFTGKSRKEKLMRVDECLERVNLKNANKLYPNELSGGMKKRVGIARAIVMNPKYLFCDEPNSGLDPLTAIVIDGLIHEITVEYHITTIINTHDMNSVMEIGDHILFLHRGIKEWEGTNKEVMNTNNKLLNDFIFASKFLKAVKSAYQQNSNT
ncbi:ABC transporter ATP-binding protein [Bacteroidota bacterium]|nr:ABC transporter ATP-binding protein [Bacteroidota bacterium]